MTKEEAIAAIKQIDELAKASKVSRMLSNPWKYFKAIGHRELFYKFNKNILKVKVKTAFGFEMNLALPSGTDIYLTGGKSHDSEIRLAKFLVNTLNEGDTFVDIGTHFGYFSLLAANLVGVNGKVLAFEASPITYQVARQNHSQVSQIILQNIAMSDCEDEMVFYEFPNLYAEYNSFNVSQYKNEPWYKANLPRPVNVNCTTMDIELKNEKPKIIKIDVEGAESIVIKGGLNHLSNSKPIVAMEYLCNDRGNKAHKEAAEMLYNIGFKPHYITEAGNLNLITNIDEYFKNCNLDSDNIVFVAKI